MKKSTLVSALVFTVLGYANLIVYIVLSCQGVVQSEVSSYLLMLAYFVIIWIPALMEILFKLKLNWALVIGFELFFAATLLAGSAWQVYDLVTDFDKIVHFASGILFALLCFDIFVNNHKNAVKPFWIFLITFAFAMMIGGVWEIVEFSFDELFRENSQQWLGFSGRDVLMDTMLDLICDFVGGIIGGFVCLLIQQRRKKRLPDLETS